MEDEKFLYGVYAADTLYPARWDKKGFFLPQVEGSTPVTALDLILVD